VPMQSHVMVESFQLKKQATPQLPVPCFA